MWTVNWDGDFVVGGDGNQRLTPAFRLKEFRHADGSVRVHRELVSLVQVSELTQWSIAVQNGQECVSGAR